MNTDTLQIKIIEPGKVAAKDQFASDVMKGLSAENKHLPSRYFYDETGSRIFEEIMKLPEYYLTNCEWDIFRKHKHAILNAVKGKRFQLVDLGAGDAKKTRVLLEHFYKEGTDFQYIPIDINPKVLEELQNALSKELPGLDSLAVAAEYFDALEWIKSNHSVRKLVLFMGSNIGNFSKAAAATFLKQMHQSLNQDDLLLIGIDLTKDPLKILTAYDDSSGVTARFNLNLLTRINRELGGNFDIRKWKHYASYNPVTGAVKSYLISQENQEVFIKSLDKSFSFDAWEPIHTEYSYKYSVKEINQLAASTGFELMENYFCDEDKFVDTVWKRK
jgi:L-histidine Nalpha-methyltransferase